LYKVEDLYPKRIFETLVYQRFSTWPEGEREAVIAHLKAIRGIISFFDEEEANEWDEGMRSICKRAQFAAADDPDEPLSNES
jgi:hypothetical protein